MVELVDTPDSKSGALIGVWVQVPLPAPPKEKAMIVTYDPYNGLVHPEYAVESAMIEKAVEGKDFTVGSILEVVYLRLMVKRGAIPPFSFYFVDGKGTEHTLQVSSEGRLKYWPTGFGDKIETWLAEM